MRACSRSLLAVWLLTSGCLAMLAGCQPAAQSVVIYTAVDQVYAEPVLKAFERETGIRVDARYDAEATKTIGVVAALEAEKDHPRADVFWNNEFLQAIALKQKGVLQPYHSPSARDLPAEVKDPDGYFTAIGGRARVLLVNTNLVPAGQMPSRLQDLLESAIPANQIAIANPLFGTTSTHAAALYAQYGAGRARAFFSELAGRPIQVVDGNSVVRDRVAAGQAAFGLTDTDDAGSAVAAGKPVRMIFPDQKADEPGTLVIPNTVMKISGAPHSQNADRLIDYLLSEKVERQLCESGWFDLSLSRPHLARLQAKAMKIDYAAVFACLNESRADLRELFVR